MRFSSNGKGFLPRFLDPTMEMVSVYILDTFNRDIVFKPFFLLHLNSQIYSFICIKTKEWVCAASYLLSGANPFLWDCDVHSSRFIVFSKMDIKNSPYLYMWSFLHMHFYITFHSIFMIFLHMHFYITLIQFFILYLLIRWNLENLWVLHHKFLRCTWKENCLTCWSSVREVILCFIRG